MIFEKMMHRYKKYGKTLLSEGKIQKSAMNPLKTIIRTLLVLKQQSNTH
jgi:hypothetical protein